MPETSLTALIVSEYWVVNWSDAGNDFTAQPFVPIEESTVRSAQVTGVPGGAVIWNFIIAVVSPPVDSNATHSIPVVWSVEKTHVTQEKNAIIKTDAKIHTVRADKFERP
ncbi:MAG: hypothetical protein RL107_428 [Actinomycetota bacterium]|jgi:hypothetical protein